MSEIFRNVTIHLKNKLPFVVYCKPNSGKTIAFFQKNDVLFSIEDNANVGFAFVSFDNEQRYIIPENESDIYFENNTDLDFFAQANTIDTAINNDEKYQFENLVTKGIDAIKRNEFEKVVLSRKKEVTIDGFDLETIFKKLLFNYKAAFKSIFYHPKVGLWAGATPEQLLKIEDGKLKTVSLAGTQVFDENKEAIWQLKEIEEQKIVTDYLAYILKNNGFDVKISNPYSFRAGSLVHYKTDLEAAIPIDFNITELTNLLHPTPAVCGFPKEKANQFIVENEHYNREFYCGFLGEWQKNFETYQENNSDLYVNLRCMQLKQNKATIYVGCGVTKDSIAEKEFFETQHKMQTMRRIL